MMANQESGILKVLVPFGSAMLIFLGVFYNSIYYRAFGVTVNNFLEISEILTLFLNKLIILAGTLFVNFLVAIKLLDFDRDHYEKVDSLKNDGKWVKWLWKRFLFMWTTFIPVSMGWIYSLIVGNPVQHLLETILITQILVLVITLTCRSIFPIIEKLVDVKLSIGTQNLIFMFLIALPLVYSYAKTEFYIVKYGGMNSNVRIETVNGPLVNDQKHYYIGNTRQYLFFYDQVANETAVYPMSEIKRSLLGNLLPRIEFIFSLTSHFHPG